LIELGVKYNFVDKAGAWYSYNGDRIGQGKENVRLFLKDNPDIANAIEKQIRDELMPSRKQKDAAEESVAETPTVE
jgi:recombination protein RecA